ncbi:MAG TPA: nucleotidyltransferase domain-containing protein, partial [Ktedonobacterales bacterium]|nr:nucleotidyltransferase domain-containing protein [Ktedonobacterales bacterium]
MNDSNAQSHPDLRMDNLPPLPQSEAIRTLAPRLWQNDQVVAIWLGGSLAAGTGDPYSDIDLRVAVSPDELAEWESSGLHTILDGPALARQLVKLGDGAFIHHMILQSGDILDLLVQSCEAAPGSEPVLVLGCHDDGLAEQLASSNQAPQVAHTPVTGEKVRELVVAFWVNSHKHRKVLHRGLDLMFPAASYANWYMLMRMWYIDATGCDTGSDHFSGIHGLTELVHAVESVNGMEPLALCGAPTQTHEEICDAIERYQE